MRGLPFLLLSVLFCPTGAFTAGAAAEPASTAGSSGVLLGTVRTSDGAALRGVGVELRGPGTPLHLTTGLDGSFRAGPLAAGEYEATVDAPGLEPRGTSRAEVGTGETTLELVLAPAPVREHVVISATRGEATLSTLGVASDVLDRERIDERAAPELLSLLQEVPGVATSRAGGTGLQGSAFIRGGESRYARVLVDGVPVNQPGGAFDFGTALPFELERVEVVRGAASSLYGSDALAGVVSLTTRRARSGESALELLLAPAPVRERVVVSATRGEATLSTLGVASDVLDRERIDERAAPELLSLLQEIPGVATSRAGGTGLQGSAFIRGGESRYARVLVDGVPVNQPGGAFDFGTALPFELDRVEVVRGAASSLYGSDALAGVVSLTTRRARPGESPSLRGEA
jgi:outer membrane cobalamin receptor